MEVILINPSFDRSRMGVFHKYVPAMLPLSLGFLAGYLLERDIRPTIIDEQLEYLSPEKVKRLVVGKDRILIGLSCLTAGAMRTYQLVRWVKTANPKAVIVYGGVHSTVMPEEAFEKGNADIVVRNEGEETLYELIQHYASGGNLEDIKGISFLRNSKVVHNPQRPLIEDLDTLPFFPYHLFEKDIDRYDFGNLITTRGCPFKCIFCSQRSISGRSYRYRSAENVIKELDTLIYRYGQRSIIFNDDNFAVNRQHVFRLCKMIIARNYPKDVSFQAMARGDMIDSDMLKLMKRAGFGTISYGLETGSERLIKMIKKDLTVKDNKEAIQLTHKAGITTNAGFILGFPTETREESLQTVRFAKSIPLDLTRFNLLVPYPGTEVYEMIKKEKKGNIRKNSWIDFITVSGFGDTAVPYVPDGRTEKEMRRLQLWANLTFYLRPKCFVRLMQGRFSNQLRLPPFTNWKGIKAYIEIAFYLITTFARTFIKEKNTNNVQKRIG